MLTYLFLPRSGPNQQFDSFLDLKKQEIFMNLVFIWNVAELKFQYESSEDRLPVWCEKTKGDIKEHAVC